MADKASTTVKRAHTQRKKGNAAHNDRLVWLLFFFPTFAVFRLFFFFFLLFSFFIKGKI